MSIDTALDISVLSTSEKLELLDMLWRDLSRDPLEIPVPEWHIRALEQGDVAILEGTEELVDMEQFESELRNTVQVRKAQ